MKSYRSNHTPRKQPSLLIHVRRGGFYYSSRQGTDDRISVFMASFNELREKVHACDSSARSILWSDMFLATLLSYRRPCRIT